MAIYHPIQNLRLRLDDDGLAHVEVVVPTGHTVDAVAEWSIDYLPDEAQQRLRERLSDEDIDASHLDVPSAKPDKGPGTHPRST